MAEYFPQLPLGMLLGLILSICFRWRPWASLIWVPTCVSFLTVAWVILKRIHWLGGLRGPDAGWGGLELIFLLLPTLAVCIAGVIACYYFRPKGKWDPRALIPAIGFSVAALAYLEWSDVSNIEIQLTDTNGHPVTDVSLEYNNRPRTHGSSKFVFPLRRQQSLELIISPTAASAHCNGEALTGWTLHFSTVKENSAKLRIRYTSSRLIGFEKSLFVAFTETVPFTRNIKIPLVLPPSGSLDADPMQNRIRAAFHSIKQVPGREDLDYGYVCRNLTAIEFIPELLALSREEQAQQYSVVQGLIAIANTLADLNDGCLELRAAITGGKPRSPAETHEKVKHLCIWAGVPSDGNSDDLKLLAQVQQEIITHARLIVDYCLEDRPTGMRYPGILSELGQLNRHLLPDFIRRLLTNPPKDMQTALGWSHVFYRMEATESELNALVESPNPLLQAAARDARHDSSTTPAP